MPSSESTRAPAEELESAIAVLERRNLLSRTRRLRVGSVTVILEPDLAQQLGALVPGRDSPKPKERLIGAPRDDGKQPEPSEEQAEEDEYSHAE